MPITRKTPATLLALLTIPLASLASAEPARAPLDITDQNMKIAFEVHSPWNILDGKAQDLSGRVSLAQKEASDRLRADVSVEKLDYSAGISASGRMVAAWLRANPPTPAKFIVAKSALGCPAKTTNDSCSGVVDGQLTIWGKDYTIDVPVEIKTTSQGVTLTGLKKINWGEYGFGDPNSMISNLKPTISLNFTIDLPPAEAAKGEK